MKEQIIRNLLSNYLTRIIGMILGLLIVPFLIHRLGAELFGLTALSESTILFFEVLTVSLRVAMSRHATFFLSQGKSQDFAEYLSAGRFLLRASSGVVFIVSSVLSYFFPVIFKIPLGYENHSRVLFFLISVGFSASIPNMVYWTVLYSKQRFDLINFSSSCALILRALCLFAVFSLLPDPRAAFPVYGLIYLVMVLGQNFVVWRAATKLMPDLKIASKGSYPEKVKDLFSFSFHASVGRLSSLLYDNTANVMINIFWGTLSNALYSVGTRFPIVARRIFLEPAWTLVPTFTDLTARNEKQKAKDLLFLYSKLASIAIIPVVCIIVVYSHLIVKTWVGIGFEEAAVVLSITMLSLVFEVPTSALAGINLACGKVSIPSQVSLLAAVVNIGLCIFLGHGLGWGIRGVAIGSVVPLVFYSAVFAPFYSCSQVGLSVAEYYRKIFFEPFLAAAATIGPFFILSVGEHEPLLKMSYAAGGVALYGAVAILFLVGREEKHNLVTALKSAVSRGR